MNNYESTQQDNASVLGIGLPKTETRPFQPVEISKKRLKDFLKDLSITYGIDYGVISKVVTCESNWNINAYNKKDEWAGGSYGISQFLPSTWQYFNELRKTELDYENPFNQLEMMAWAFSTNKANHWSCYNRLYGKRKI